MLKKELRIKKERDFNKIYRKGAFLGGDFFNINYIDTRGSETRLAVVISKKIAKKAVERNQVKRKVREALRILYPSLVQGYDIVVGVKKEALDKEQDFIKNELKKQLGRKGLFRE